MSGNIPLDVNEVYHYNQYIQSWFFFSLLVYYKQRNFYLLQHVQQDEFYFQNVHHSRRVFLFLEMNNFVVQLMQQYHKGRQLLIPRTFSMAYVWIHEKGWKEWKRLFAHLQYPRKNSSPPLHCFPVKIIIIWYILI